MVNKHLYLVTDIGIWRQLKLLAVLHTGHVAKNSVNFMLENLWLPKNRCYKFLSPSKTMLEIYDHPLKSEVPIFQNLAPKF